MATRKVRVGDAVTFNMGLTKLQGVVTEDRGPIGVKGRRLYLIEFRYSPPSDEPRGIELPADEFEVVEPQAASK